jgi:hypothetical protein
VAVVLDAVDIDPGAAQHLAAACALVEKAVAADRQVLVWLPGSGTPDVEPSADAPTVMLPVEPREHLHRSPRPRVAAAPQ